MFQPGELSAVPNSSAVGVGYRFLAVLLDAVILAIIGCPIWFIAVATGDGGFSDVSGASSAVSGLNSLIYLAYFIGMETLRGATLGKMVLGLKVVKLDGSRPDWGASIVRNVLRLVDLFPYFLPYLLGAILIWSSPRRQRLGDRLANTMVVRKDAVPAITGYQTQRF